MIKVLSEDTISQISAGEVVENPSHLIKELVENSIDAGATEIEISFDQGGRFVKVKDNGCGIAPKDMPLALARYATSKIDKTEDIWKIHSFGFRGEALASISSVSDLTLISGLTNSKSYQLRNVFGKEHVLEDSYESKGTTVIVRSLFENTPARFKFLKSEGAENSNIKNTLKALALSNKHVCFRVLQKGKLLFYWPSQKKLLNRVSQILNCQELYFTENQQGDYKLSAVLAPPHITLKNKKNSWFFVQNRWVESRVIYAGLMAAYRGLLMHGEYPLSVIQIQGPPGDIDVNVHPSKSQIRFKNSSFIFKLVENSLRQLLEQAPWTKKIISPRIKEKERNLQLNEKAFNKTNWKQNRTQQAYSKEILSQIAWKKEDFPLLEEKNKTLNPIKYKINSKPKNLSWSDLQVLAQAHLTYIICQSSHSLIFIDQHASHERILYERLFNSWKKGEVEIQKQLIPFTVDLEEGQSSMLLELKQDLKNLGVHIESIGPNSILISSAPPIIKPKALQEGLLFLAKKRMETGDSFSFEKIVSDLCATLACHSAIRAGKSLKQEEMEELLKQMDEFPLSSFCPHGRPVFVEYPISKLEKDFGRIT
ncbi:MAG: DNA mismatch repair endonuclease MutL [Bdellovibrionales bacterium]|nr:DNA mismatch repair endonuclease MutL [Bdellovibrionales bacterium]